MTKELSPEVCIEFRNADKGNRYVDMSWLDLTVPWEDVTKTLDNAMRNAPLAMNDTFPCDYAITEVNDMCGLQFEQYEKLEHVHMLAQLVVKHGPAFALWYEHDRPSNKTASEMEDAFLCAYAGCFMSPGDYARQLNKYENWYKAMPPGVECYLDWASVERDMESRDIWKVDRDCHVYVFLCQHS